MVKEISHDNCIKLHNPIFLSYRTHWVIALIAATRKINAPVPLPITHNMVCPQNQRVVDNMTTMTACSIGSSDRFRVSWWLISIFTHTSGLLKTIREYPLMTSLVFWLFLTYLPTGYEIFCLKPVQNIRLCQIQKGQKVLLWNRVKSKMEACYSQSFQLFWN